MSKAYIVKIDKKRFDVIAKTAATAMDKASEAAGSYGSKATVRRAYCSTHETRYARSNPDYPHAWYPAK